MHSQKQSSMSHENIMLKVYKFTQTNKIQDANVLRVFM